MACQRCLLIADDLTGGADAGVQFAKKGLNTFLISLIHPPAADFSKFPVKDVLVISTNSRGARPEDAFRIVCDLLESYNRESFPILYKKIDSTLRGNIGHEIDAILKQTGLSSVFFAPSFPEQDRTVAGGIHLVGGTPLSLTEISRDAVSPVRESYVKKLLEKQSGCRIGNIDLIQVASGGEVLKKAVDESRQEGTQILVFDAVERRDLAHIAEVGFQEKEKPLFVGSAGLAEEIAKKLSLRRKPSRFLKQGSKPLKHILVVSGSASKVSHEQLDRAERIMGIPSFQIDRSFMRCDEAHRQKREDGMAIRMRRALIQGHAILKTTPERILPNDSEALPIPIRITQGLARLTVKALEISSLEVFDVALVLFGGDTALSVLEHLGMDGMEIEGEITKGVVIGRLAGGRWHGLRLVTKAGAFGKGNTLEKIVKTLAGK